MAPANAQQSKIIPKNDFSKQFGSFKTQQFTDPGTRSGIVHRTIAWNAKGELVATGASDKVIRVWNLERAGNRPQCELKGHALEVTKVLFNPVREFELASCSKDGTVRLWDVRTKTCLTKLDVTGDLFSLAWSLDGAEMVVGNKNEVLTRISTASNATATILEKHKQKLETNQTTFSNAYSPPRDLLITHGDGSIRILDYPSFEILHTLSSHTSSCSSIAYSPTGKHIAVGGSDAMIALWDTYDWVCKRTVSNPSSGKVTALSWSWDGRYLTAACEDTTSGSIGDTKSAGFDIYHAESGDVVYTVPTGTSPVPAVAWHPTSYVLAYTQVENGKSSLKVIGMAENTT